MTLIIATGYRIKGIRISEDTEHQERKKCTEAGYSFIRETADIAGLISYLERKPVNYYIINKNRGWETQNLQIQMKQTIFSL